MKTIVCLIGVATLLLANGCAHERGGSYGTQESQRGEYASRPDGRDRGYYWDRNGNYHEYYDGKDHQYGGLGPD